MARRDTLSRDITFEEAAELDPDEHAAELVEGRLVPVSRGTWRHGRITGNVYFALRLYSNEHDGWTVATADPGTKLGRNPATLRGPDVGMIRTEREPKGRGVEGWLEGAPDLAVEVKGDDTSTSELIRKALEYLGAGAKVVWIVDPDAEQVVVFTPPDHARVVGRDETLDGGDVLPGFGCRVADLFV